jgi:hypothetical protein
MKTDSSNMVSIHPYFKAKPGKLPEIKALLPAFVAKTASEKDNLFYDFTLNGDELFCREAYRGAAGALAHLDNVGALLGELIKLADLTRLEVHGPGAELAKLKSPMANLNPIWFIPPDGV